MAQGPGHRAQSSGRRAQEENQKGSLPNVLRFVVCAFFN